MSRFCPSVCLSEQKPIDLGIIAKIQCKYRNSVRSTHVHVNTFFCLCAIMLKLEGRQCHVCIVLLVHTANNYNSMSLDCIQR